MRNKSGQSLPAARPTRKLVSSAWTSPWPNKGNAAAFLGSVEGACEARHTWCRSKQQP